jgi:hypothetical protein
MSINIYKENAYSFFVLTLKKLKRKMNTLKKSILENERPTSYPFISGDTFRSICDVIIENKQDFEIFNNFDENNKDIKKVFISLSFIHKNEKYLIDNLSKRDYRFNNINLILHNGDKIPSEEFFLKLSKLFNKVYCVNSMSNRKNIIAIPIGLENYHFFNNGKIEELIQYNNYINIKRKKKDIILFSCFDLSTNYELRKPIQDKFIKSRFSHVYKALNKKKYINHLKRALFVISPPGNGLDCHRNWEAIYYDCIPVVLNNFLPQQFIENLPILAVNSYDEILNMSESELGILYNKMIKYRNLEMAYFDYWYKKIYSCE